MLLDSLTHTLRAANTTSSASLKRIIKIKKVLNFANQNEVQPRLQNSRIFCERGRPSICKRKAVWSECEKGEGEWGETRLARFTSEDRAYSASRLPKTSENDCFAV